MKLPTTYLYAFIYSISHAAFVEPQVEVKNFDNRADAAVNNKGSCSIGIGREQNSPYWDITVYNVPQPQRQDINIIARLTNQHMGKGDSIKVPSPAKEITITNVDNAPTFTYNEPELKASFADKAAGLTKVTLKFDIKDGNTTWTTEHCGTVNVVLSGGRESWSCEFPCTVSLEKEL